MATLEYCATLANQSPHALTVAQSRSFFDAIFGPFGSAPEHAEDSGVSAQVDGVIPPVARRNHPPIKVQDLCQFALFEADLIMSTDPGKGRDDRAQLAVLPLDRRGLAGASRAVASRSSIISATFLRKVSISHCMISRLWVAGSNISRQGVP